MLVHLARYIEANGQQEEEVDLTKVKVATKHITFQPITPHVLLLQNVHKSRSLWPQLRRRVGDGTAKLSCHSNVAVPFFALDNVDVSSLFCTYGLCSPAAVTAVYLLSLLPLLC